MKRTLSFSMFVVAALTRHRGALLRDGDAPSETLECAGWGRPRKNVVPLSSAPSISDREQMAGEALSLARTHSLLRRRERTMGHAS